MVCYGWFFDFTILHYRTYDLRRRTNQGEAARKTSCLGAHEEDENAAVEITEAIHLEELNTNMFDFRGTMASDVAAYASVDGSIYDVWHALSMGVLHSEGVASGVF